MTVNELRNAVALLGFTTELADTEEESRFFSSANLAIQEIARTLPVRKWLLLHHTGVADGGNDLVNGYICYDLDGERYGGNVGAILSLPCLRGSISADTDSYAVGHKVYISEDAEAGDYDVEVEVRPSSIGPDQGDDQLPLPQEQHDLVPLLSAMYLWMDDEPTKAQFYKALYDEQVSLSMQKRKPRGKSGGGFRDLYGYV